MDQPTCQTCRHWRHPRPHLYGNEGTCHAHAPRPVPFTGPYERADPATAYALWPVTLADEFCGEHRARDGETDG